MSRNLINYDVLFEDGRIERIVAALVKYRQKENEQEQKGFYWLSCFIQDEFEISEPHRSIGYYEQMKRKLMQKASVASAKGMVVNHNDDEPIAILTVFDALWKEGVGADIVDAFDGIIESKDPLELMLVMASCGRLSQYLDDSIVASMIQSKDDCRHFFTDGGWDEMLTGFDDLHRQGGDQIWLIFAVLANLLTKVFERLGSLLDNDVANLFQSRPDFSSRILDLVKMGAYDTDVTISNCICNYLVLATQEVEILREKLTLYPRSE